MRYIYLILILIAFSCSNKQKSNKEDLSKRENTKDNVIDDSKELVHFKWRQVDSLMFSDSIAKDIAYNSIFSEHIEMCYIEPEIFSIVLTPDLGEYYNTPLDCGNNIRSIIKTGFKIVDTMTVEEKHLYKLKFKNSEIYHSGNVIAHSHILDSTLKLNFGLKIGMTKKEFFNVIMEGKKIPQMDSLKVFELGELLDEGSQTYFFKEDKLIAIVTDIHDHWMISELNIQKWRVYNKWYRRLRFGE